MKLSPEVLLEIVSIFQDAMLNGTDASNQLRELDLSFVHGIPKVEGGTNERVDTLILSQDYLDKYPRATVWPEQDVEEV